MALNKGQTNGSLPLLTLSPVSFSLTEGTPIPAPEEDSTTLQLTNGDTTHPDFRGPLSSHPITPINGPEDRDTDEFPGYDWSREVSSKITNGTKTSPGGTGSASAAYHAQTIASTSGQNGTSRQEKHASHASDDSNNFDPALPPHQPTRDTSRRPSFVERFLPRLRSSNSFLRSRSKSSLGQYGESTSNLSQMAMRSRTDDTRGLKRPASPNDAARPGSRGGASTFPRMVRKKSMELFGSARRKSGMWTANEREEANRAATASAMEQERERERLRELEEQQQRLPVKREPPPQIQLGGGGRGLGGAALDGEAMFGSIGR